MKYYTDEKAAPMKIYRIYNAYIFGSIILMLIGLIAYIALANSITDANAIILALPIIALIVFFSFLCAGLYKKTKWGFILNQIYLGGYVLIGLIEIIYCAYLSTKYVVEDGLIYQCVIIFLHIICYIPLIFYFEKRKYIFFGAKQKTIKTSDSTPFAQTAVNNFIQIPQDKENIAKIFKSGYTSMLQHAKKTSYAFDPEFELLPAMFVVCDFAALSSDKDRKVVADIIVSEIKALCPNYNDEKFNRRADLYASAIQGKGLRGDWFLGDLSCFDNPISRCALMLGDILFNPECADNYESAPIRLLGFSDCMVFSEKTMMPILGELTKLFSDIYDYEINVAEDEPVISKPASISEATQNILKEKEAKRTSLINRIKKIAVFATAIILMLLLATCAVRSCSSETNKTAATTQVIYIGNKNSKVFHSPSCANLPAKKNQREFTSRSAAVNAGYRPCQNCDP